MVLEGLKHATQNPVPLLNAVGLFMVGRTQQAFRDQGRDARWLPRGVPNRVGILTDLEQGRAPPERRFEDRPAAIDTGRLRASIAYRVAGGTVTVGSNLAYASDVQRGSAKTIRVEGQVRSALAEWLRSLTGDRQKAMRRAFGFLFHAGSLTVNVPPRPYLVVTDADRKTIRDMAARFFSGGYLK